MAKLNLGSKLLKGRKKVGRGTAQGRQDFW